jgi:hypothetical protein
MMSVRLPPGVVRPHFRGCTRLGGEVTGRKSLQRPTRLPRGHAFSSVYRRNARNSRLRAHPDVGAAHGYV